MVTALGAAGIQDDQIAVQVERASIDTSLDDAQILLPVGAARGIRNGILISLPVWAMIIAMMIYLF